MRPQRFDTEYLPIAGVLMIFAEDFVIWVRMSDGFSKKWSYEELGF